MTRARSPGYPNMSLPDALARITKVFDSDRRYPIDRAVVAKHIGYGGLNGAADKSIAALMHYDLLERVGKGEVRVSQLAVDILHPNDDKQRRVALYRAATSPVLFKSLQERFPDNRASESALRSYLVRLGFVESAVDPVIRAYTDTCRYLEQAGASESGGDPPETEPESIVVEDLTPPSPVAANPVAAPRSGPQVVIMPNERELLSGMMAKDATFRLIVTGRVGVKEIDRLIRKLELDKEILADAEGNDADPDPFAE